ncbi:MAG: ATP-binding protein [Gemmatimonadota bacterium]
MSEKPLLPRALAPLLESRLATFPVVVVIGARQTGKTTLTQGASGNDRLYATLDDLDVRDQAERTPEELLRRARRMTLDEVQRAPDLLSSIKREVDREREVGRFLLTGSANLLLMRKVSESLAGRAVYLILGPLTPAEQSGLGRTGRWTTFFEEAPARWLDAVSNNEMEIREPWEAFATRGGYPVPAYHMDDAATRAAWFDGYVRTYLERDLRDLASVDNLADFRRLMRGACLRVGNLLNQAELARDVGLPPSTAQRYLGLMETSFQLLKVEAFSVNRTKRLTKSPKLFWTDTGLALHLAGESEPRGAHLENLILNDLLAWKEGLPNHPQVLYWRTSKGAEVDFVVEWGDRVLPIEVKSGRRVRTADARHLRTFLEEYPDLAPAVVILYGGDETFWIGDRILAAPWRRIL